MEGPIVEAGSDELSIKACDVLSNIDVSVNLVEGPIVEAGSDELSTIDCDVLSNIDISLLEGP